LNTTGELNKKDKDENRSCRTPDLRCTDFWEISYSTTARRKFH